MCFPYVFTPEPLICFHPGFWDIKVFQFFWRKILFANNYVLYYVVQNRCFYLKCLKAAWMLSLSVQVPLTLELLVTCTTNLKHTVCAKQSNIALTLWLCYDVVITSATVILWQWLQNTYISVVLQIWPQEFDSILLLFSCSEDFSVKLNEDLTHISALDILPTSFLSVG